MQKAMQPPRLNSNTVHKAAHEARKSESKVDWGARHESAPVSCAAPMQLAAGAAEGVG